MKKSKRKGYMLVELLVAIPLVAFSPVVEFFSPILPVVAVLTDSIDAQWQGVKAVPVKGDTLRQGKMSLTQGFAEITFFDGAVVVVESPAVFELQGPDSILLSTGKINVHVPNSAAGFTVSTPSAHIVDLGTEFSVSVKVNGSCDMQVYEGSVCLISGNSGETKISQVVNVNQAMRVDIKNGSAAETEFRDNFYVRSIDSTNGLIFRGQLK